MEESLDADDGIGGSGGGANRAQPAAATRAAAGGSDWRNPESFLFNLQSAARYQEWDVIKTNKWGKRQRRVIGVDMTKEYNKHRKLTLALTLGTSINS